MLNLIFDADDPKAALDSRFKPYVAQTDVLLCSKAWLQPSATAPTAPNYDVSGAWTLKQEDTGDPLILQGGTQGDQIVIRVLGLNTQTNANGTWLARLTVVVSRDTARTIKNAADNNKPYQTRASPFPSGSLVPLNTQSCVIYDYENLNYQPVNSGTGTGTTSISWIQPLGAAQLTTQFQSNKPAEYGDAYAVIAAVTVGQGAAGGQNADPTNLKTYSHDPDMNVQC